MQKIKNSLKNIDYKLFISLIILGLGPTVYTTVRIFFIGQIPSEYAFSVAGQLSWVNLIYEILNEAIILPLFYFLGAVVSDKAELVNRIKTGLIITFGVFLLLAVIIIVFAETFLRIMATDITILAESAAYIRLESMANVFSMSLSFVLVALVTIGKAKYVYIVTMLKVILGLIADLFLVSSLSFSIQLGVNGIAISNIIVNVLLLIVIQFFLKRESINLFSKDRCDFSWVKNFVKIGGLSGVESLIRNLAYMLMVVRMVNVVNEQGTYWIVNNFIWGWLLLPITQLAELIKRDCAADNNAIKDKTVGYLCITATICLLWCVSIPLWGPFMSVVLRYDNVDKLIDLTLLLLGFYVLYAFQNIFDATFYGIGKTNYMIFESIVTNTVYYGGAFILYISGIWEPTLTGIALMFGCGMAFDSVVSFCAYLYLLKKRKINPLKN